MFASRMMSLKPEAAQMTACGGLRRTLATQVPQFLILIGLGSLVVLLSDMRGTLGVPVEDAWSYLSVAFKWAEGGHLVLNGWVHMMFVSQGLLGAVMTNAVGASVWLLNLTTLLVGIGGLSALYYLGRSLLPATLSLVVVAMAGLSPLWLRLAASYMTDVPAWALATISLTLGVVACRHLCRLWLTLSVVVGLAAFGIREYAVLPTFVLLIWVVWMRFPRGFRLWSLFLGILTAVTCSFAYFWRQSLPGSVNTAPSELFDSLVLTSRLTLTLAFLLAPYAAVSAVLTWSRRGGWLEALRTYWLGASFGVVVAVGIAFSSSLQLAGNVIHPYGSSWTSVGDGVRSLPPWGFRAVTLVAVVSLIALLALVGMFVQRRVIARSWRIPARLQGSSSYAGLYVFISVAVMAVYFVAIIFSGAPAFDRYLLLVVPLLGIVILWVVTRFQKERVSKWQRSGIALVLVVTGAFGIVITDGLNQVDGLRWQVASELEESGIPAYKIDGGDAWFRYHQKDAPGVAPVGSLANSIPGRTWWQTFFEGSTFCRMVAIESETDLQAMYGPALSIQGERTLLGTPFRIMVFPGPDPC